ncbi:MAG: hypothetical protein ACFFD2_13165 [Promethearchaeota archaeon]
MTSDKCESIIEKGEQETNLIKRGIIFNKVSQYYLKINDLEQYKSNKEKAIESFQKQVKKIKDPYEKSLIYSYEALCWICLEKYENAKALIDKIRKMEDDNPKFTHPSITDFTKFLLLKDVEKAEELWNTLHNYFSSGIIELLEEAFITVNPTSEPPTINKFIKLKNMWSVLMAGKSKDAQEDWSLTFFDATEIFKQKLVINNQFLDNLIKKIREIEYYHFIRNVRSVISPSGEDFSDKAIDIVLATSTKKKLKFGVIFGSLKDGGLHVLAIWPEALAKAIVEDKEVLGAFISRLIESPEWYSDVNLITYLSNEDKGIRDNKNEESSNETNSLPGYYT